MKRIVILFALIPVLMNAQVSDRQVVSLSAGVSVPMGDFQKKLLSDSTSGFAKTGIAINFNYSYRVTHNFGLQAMVTYSSNKLDNTGYRDQLEQAHPDYGVSVESTKNWSSGGLMAGPYLTFPIADLFRWDIRALGGYFGAYSPKVTVRATNINDPSDKKEYYVNSTKAYDFGYMLGTGFRFTMNSYYLMLFGDYTNVNVKFDNASGWDWDNEPYVTSFEQQISYFTVTVGIGYKL